MALPFRDRGKGALQADTIPSVNEDVEMRDAASISTENAGGKVVVSENGLQHGGDGTIDRSSSKGKGTALSTSEELRPRGVIEAGDRSNPVTQNVAQSTEMASSGNEYRNDEDHKDEDNGGDGIKGRYGKFHQVYPAKMVNPPVQEVHVTEDGTLEVRPEVVSVTGSGKK